MQNRYFILLLFQLSLYPLLAQLDSIIIETELNSDAVNLVRDVFITGTCKNVSNIQSTGAPESFAVFQNGANIIGFADGIILSTGDARSAEGPNESIETSARFGRSSLDRDLVDIATDSLFDVTVLEFDFVPVDPEVTFQYVFASEEYCEYVGTAFNDVFGFFVSGPGINGPFSDGAINVARLPNSEETVSINTVNHATNQSSYVKNELRDDVDNCNIVFDPGHLFTIEYDGFTIPLLARFPVIPCETYHIRLVVADVGDDRLDSAVFLRSNSFDLGEVATVKSDIPNRPDTISYENCIDGQFVFSRPRGGIDLQPLDIEFEIAGGSSAMEGVDFSSIPRIITIPAGQDTVVMAIESLLDSQAENIESLTLNLILSQSCECVEGGSATLRIADPLPPIIDFTSTFACSGQPFYLVPEISAGVPPFSYQWNDNSTNESLQATVTSPTNFALTLTDFCNNQVIDSTMVNIQDLPTALLWGEVSYCNGQDEVILPLRYSGQPPWSFTYQINNNIPITIDSIFDNAFQLPISESGNYQLLSFTDAACMGEASGTGLVNDMNIELTVEVISPSCLNASDGQINLDILAANAPYEINWSPMVNDANNPTNLSVGVYDLTISDAENCEYLDSIAIEGPLVNSPECENEIVYIPNVFSPDGDGRNDFFEIFLADETTVQQILKVEILDRWGNLVYLSEGTLPKWDGRFNGKKLNPAVFLYEIQLELNENETKLLQGSLHLIR